MTLQDELLLMIEELQINAEAMATENRQLKAEIHALTQKLFEGRDKCRP